MYVYVYDNIHVYIVYIYIYITSLYSTLIMQNLTGPPVLQGTAHHVAAVHPPRRPGRDALGVGLPAGRCISTAAPGAVTGRGEPGPARESRRSGGLP